MRLFLLLLLAGCVSVNKSPDIFKSLSQKKESVCPGIPSISMKKNCIVSFSEFMGLPVIKAKTPTDTLYMLVDTGSQFCLLRPGIVEKLNLPVAKNARLSLLGLTSKSIITCLHDFLIGDIRCKHIPFLVTPGHLSKSLLWIQLQRLDGVLGISLLKKFTLTFDFQKKTLFLSREIPVWLQNNNNFHVIPLEFLPDGRPQAQISLPGIGKLLFLIDTGSHKNVIPGKLAEKLGLKKEKTAHLLSFGKEIQAMVTTIKGASLGDIRLKPLTSFVVEEKYEGMLGHAEGILGINSLKDYIVTFDFAHKWLFLVTPSAVP